MRPIDADALKNKLCEDCFGDCTRDCYEAHLIKAQPTIKFGPVHYGRWIKMSDADGIFYACSECGEWHKETSNYCPNCGAKMEEQE